MKLTLAAMATAILLIVSSTDRARSQTSSHPLPNPVLNFVGQKAYSTKGKNFIQYKYEVANAADFPDALFAAAPSLPPCGRNKNSSRTWVDIYDARGMRLYGFCALAKSSDLNTISFYLPDGEPPPSWIYIELNDRETGMKYKSNLAETTF